MNGSNRPNGWLLRRRALAVAIVLWIGLPTSTVIAGVLEPGDLVVADRFQGLFRVDPITGQKLLLSSDGLLDRDIGGVAINADGTHYATVASNGGTWARGNVVKVDPDTGKRELLSDGVGYLARTDLKTGSQTIISEDRKISPCGMAFDANNDLIVLGRLPGRVATGEIVRMDPFTGQATQLTSLGFLRDPNGLAVGLGDAFFLGTTGPPPQGPLKKFQELVRVDPDTHLQTVLTTFFSIDDTTVVQPPTNKGDWWLKRKRCLKRKSMSAYGKGY